MIKKRRSRMSLNEKNLISKNISSGLKDEKRNIICFMDDVRDNLIRSPHGTTPVVVK